jgi:hypothetical protein
MTIWIFCNFFTKFTNLDQESELKVRLKLRKNGAVPKYFKQRQLYTKFPFLCQNRMLWRREESPQVCK